MQDKETGSLWSHVTGECLDGELKGSQLRTLPSVQTTWAQWRQDHPDTRVLKKSEEVKSPRYEHYYEDPNRAGLFRTIWLQDKMPAQTLVHGVKIGSFAMAVRDDLLKVGQPQKTDVGGVPVVITRGPDGGVRAVRSDTGEELVVRTAFWFAWSNYFPNTGVVESP